jgi:hypothetical protein
MVGHLLTSYEMEFGAWDRILTGCKFYGSTIEPRNEENVSNFLLK